MRKISSQAYIIFPLTALLYSSALLAQLSAKNKWSAGISVGYTNNEFYTNISNYDYNYYKKEGGFVVGAPVQYSFAKWFLVQAEPCYVQKSFSLWQTLQTVEPTHLTSRYNYLQLPVMAHLSIGDKKWRGFVNLGGYGAYWLSGHIMGDQADVYNGDITSDRNISFPTQPVNDKYEFDSRRDRRLQWGWVAGIGLQYAINTKAEIFAECRYYEDETDGQKPYMREQMPRYNLTTSISAGCVLHFPLLQKRK